jgi:hypothetical protein
MPATNPQKPFRAITFTDFDIENPPNWDTLQGSLRYLAYGLEPCPTTSKQHYQGFAYAFKAQRFTAFKKLFPKAHIEQMKGNFRDTSSCSWCIGSGSTHASS